MPIEAKFLQLLQLCDSALPIGAAAHSFGLETMVEERHVAVEGLFAYMRDLLQEGMLLEAIYCRAAWVDPNRSILNHRLSALKPARESRQASLALGKRLLSLAANLEPSLTANEETLHLCIAFGYVAGGLGVEVDRMGLEAIAG